MEGVNGFQFHYPTEIWRKLRPQYYHPVKHFIKFPPGLYYQRQPFAWGLVSKLRFFFFFFNLGSQQPMKSFRVCLQLAWLSYLREIDRMRKTVCAPQPDLEASLLIWIQWSWSVWPWENPQEEIENQWESLRKNLKCIGNESCWVLALRKPHCGFAFCLSPGLRGWQESRNYLLFHFFLWWREWWALDVGTSLNQKK